MIKQSKWIFMGGVVFACAFAAAQPNERIQGRGENPVSSKGVVTGTKGVYAGDLVGGKRQGQGTLRARSEDGSEETYVGNWSDDRKNGVGVLKTSAFTYEGEFKNDQPNGKGIQKFVNGDSYEGEWVNGRRQGFGTYRWANGVMSEGDWFEDERSGFNFRTARDGEVNAEYFVKGVKALASGDLRSLSNRPNGCNGQFDGWILLAGTCTRQGLAKDKNGNIPALSHRETFDRLQINDKQGVLTLFRQGIVIEGPLREPFNFVSAAIKRPVLAADGKSIAWLVEYSGPMQGLAMHGPGKCALPAGGMEDCTMNEGQRVTASIAVPVLIPTESKRPGAALAATGVAADPASNPINRGNDSQVPAVQSAPAPDKDLSRTEFAALLASCDKKEVKSCVAAAKKILANEALPDVTDPDSRQRLALDLLDKAIAVGSVDAMNAEFDIFDTVKLPSAIAFLWLQRQVGLISELEKADEDSAKLRIAYHNLTTSNPLKMVFGAIDGRMNAYCNQLRLIRAKGDLPATDSAYVVKALDTTYCKK
ncbi:MULTISPECIES: MORN repeat-containing protein [Polaromonas]|uniref:MORN repeat-containing protein n=1 Tax=Polaromonas aquatica TaxID=332657 RepID=A0ABW1TYT7_9BURK